MSYRCDEIQSIVSGVKKMKILLPRGNKNLLSLQIRKILEL